MSYPGMAEFFKGRPVFVTGATGFVGGHLARRLLQYGADVHVLVRHTSNPEKVDELKRAGAKLHYGDLADRAAIVNAVRGMEYVFHIGALYREAKHADEVFFKTNLEGTRNVLDAAREHGVKRFVYCSTTGVHSHIENPPADEDAPFNPADVYQVSKAEAEKLVKEYLDNRLVKGTIIRPAMIWGEGDSRFLKMFKGIVQRKMPLIGDGKTWTHWIYVGDLVDAFLLSAMKEEAVGKVYLIAGEKPIPLAEVYRTIADIARVKLLPFRIPVLPLYLAGAVIEFLCKPFGLEPPLHRRRVNFFVKNRAFKTERAQHDLGFQPQHSFKEEAKIIFDWYRDAGWLG